MPKYAKLWGGEAVEDSGGNKFPPDKWGTCRYLADTKISAKPYWSS